MNTIQYHSPNGVRYGLLVSITPNFINIMIQEPGMHVKKLPRTEDRYVKYLSTPSTRRMQRYMKRSARMWGCQLSKAAKAALKPQEK